MATKLAYNQIDGAPVNVLNYGASASGTEAANVTAIQAAIDAVSAAGGGVVLIPELIPTNAVINLKNKVVLRGEGWHTGIDCSGLQAIKLDRANAPATTTPFEDCGVENMYVESEWDGVSPSHVYSCITMELCKNSWVRNVKVGKADDSCIRWTGYKGDASEFTARVYKGRHSGSDNASGLADVTVPFSTSPDLVGMVVYNLTDGSSGTITANTATAVTATLSGGTDNDWDNGDVYEILNPDYGYGSGNICEGNTVREGYIGIEVEGGGYVDVIGNTVETSYYHGIRLPSCYGGVIADNEVQACVHTALYIDASKDLRVYGNRLSSDRNPTTAISLGSNYNIAITGNVLKKGTITDTVIGAADAHVNGLVLKDNIINQDGLTAGWDGVDLAYVRNLDESGNQGYSTHRWRNFQLSSSGTTGTTIAKVTIPNEETFIAIEVFAVHSRAPASGSGTSRISKETYSVGRNVDGDVVITTLTSAGEYEATSTTAGGATNASAMNLACARADANAATEPQTVKITCDFSGGLRYTAGRIEVVGVNADNCTIDM